MWQNILLVGLGSMLGGVSRYLFSDWVKHLFPHPFPFGTFLINIIGCFLLGIISGLFSSQITHAHRLFFAVGFCGSFTTFSTFAMENFQLLNHKAYILLSLNIGASVILGIVFAGIGYWLVTK